MTKQLYQFTRGLTTIIFMMMTMLAYAQSGTISGKVTDDTGAGLPGVNILIKGTTEGTTTDSDGNYKLQSRSAEDIFVFSFIGYLSEEVKIGSQTTVNVAMMPDISTLSEVVVVGYGTTLKKDITTAVVSVDPTKIPNAANSGVTDLLFGKAAGVQVNQASAQPGGQVNLSIRGRGNPLVVVDGIIVPSDALEAGVNFAEIDNTRRGNLGGINPNDIESIEILKDASAAIYGVNAANGVILITTKKGKQGAPTVTYNGSYSLSKNLPYLKPLNGPDYMRMYNRLQEDRYLAANNMAPFGPNSPAGFTPQFS